jgi:ankyrin repeat protein
MHSRYRAYQHLLLILTLLAGTNAYAAGRIGTAVRRLAPLVATTQALSFVQAHTRPQLHTATSDTALVPCGFTFVPKIKEDIEKAPEAPFDQYGNTPLTHAVIYGDLHTVIDLITKDPAAVDCVNKYNMTALKIAVLKGEPAIVEALIKAGADVDQTGFSGDPLIVLADCQEAMIMSLIAAGADVSKTGSKDHTAVWSAAYNGNMTILEALLQAHANIFQADENGFTPLIIAAQNSHNNAVNRLIHEAQTYSYEYQYDYFNATTTFGTNALMQALVNPCCISNNLIEIVNLLIPLTANLNHKNNNGDSALKLVSMQIQKLLAKKKKPCSDDEHMELDKSLKILQLIKKTLKACGATE